MLLKVVPFFVTGDIARRAQNLTRSRSLVELLSQCWRNDLHACVSWPLGPSVKNYATRCWTYIGQHGKLDRYSSCVNVQN